MACSMKFVLGEEGGGGVIKLCHSLGSSLRHTQAIVGGDTLSPRRVAETLEGPPLIL